MMDRIIFLDFVFTLNKDVITSIAVKDNEKKVLDLLGNNVAYRYMVLKSFEKKYLNKVKAKKHKDNIKKSNFSFNKL